MSRSNRTTGANRHYKGSGPVGRLPVGKAGNPYKERRKTKPLVAGKHTTGAYHDGVLRGRQKMAALVKRAFKPEVRPNRLAAAVRNAIARKE